METSVAVSALYTVDRDFPAHNLRRLRDAIRQNFVTFPSNMPIFFKSSRPEIQWRVALLYFIRGWSCAAIGKRYGFSKQRANQLIIQWTNRALANGYIARIPD